MKKRYRHGIVTAYDYEQRIALIASSGDCFYTVYSETNNTINEGDTVRFEIDLKKRHFARSVTALKNLLEE